MRLNARSVFALASSCTLFMSATALAHIGINTPGFSGTSQVITFSVGHGCAGADTVGVEIKVPKEITTVRGGPSFFGFADVKTDDKGAITVVWTKDEARPTDDQFYELQLRIKVPELPFQTLYFLTTQHCRAANGDLSTTEWVGTASSAADVEPAPHLLILPPRQPGWNKYVVDKAVSDLTVFDDAQIVWAGDGAYSSNPATAELIASEEGVTKLTKIPAKTEIWVKY